MRYITDVLFILHTHLTCRHLIKLVITVKRWALVSVLFWVKVNEKSAKQIGNGTFVLKKVWKAKQFFILIIINLQNLIWNLQRLWFLFVDVRDVYFWIIHNSNIVLHNIKNYFFSVLIKIILLDCIVKCLQWLGKFVNTLGKTFLLLIFIWWETCCCCAIKWSGRFTQTENKPYMFKKCIAGWCLWLVKFINCNTV